MNCGGGQGPSQAKVAKVIGDLRAIHASGNSSVQRKLLCFGRDVVHSPVRERSCNVVSYYNEAARAARGFRPGQLGRLIASARVRRAVVINRNQRQGPTIGEGCAAQLEFAIAISIAISIIFLWLLLCTDSQ
jgi:hypothetical protein